MVVDNSQSGRQRTALTGVSTDKIEHLLKEYIII
jgi:hypothetical protein